MAYDKSKVDVYGEFSAYVNLQGAKKATTHNGEWCVKCPLPGCTSHNDALQIWPYRVPDEDDNVTNFWCRRCNQHGDVVTFIALMDGLSNSQAAEKLGLVKGSISGPKKPRPIRVNLDEPPSDVWMGAAMDFVKECRDFLHGPGGKPAVDWLHARGLSDETIDKQWYGYNPRDRFEDLAMWDVFEGKKIWLPRGIVIPWTVGNQLWKVSIRRGAKDIAKDEKAGYKPRKYVAVKGGSNAIYRINTIKAGQPLVIQEGEFDADLLAQLLAQAGITNVSSIATGSTDKGRADNWLVRIAQASPVLFSFDPDAGGTEAIKEYWSKVLPSGTAWPGVGGDITEMHLAGRDVVKWFTTGLQIASLAPIVPPVAEIEEVDIFKCATCGISADVAEDYYIALDGSKGFCGVHWVPEDVHNGQDDIVQPVEPDEKIEEARIRTLDKEEIMQKFVDALPGWKVETLPCSADEYISGERLRIQQANNAHRLAKITNAAECPHYVPRSEHKGHCKGKPVHDGWCETHAHGSEIMALGQSCDFMALRINEALSIGEGVYGWLAYAELSVPDRVKEVRRAVNRKTKALKAVESVA